MVVHRTIPLLSLLIGSLLLLSAFSCESSQRVSELTVYTYDSFSAKGGLGPVMAEAFEKKYDIKTRFVSFDSAGEALNQISLEGEETEADLLVGVDETLLDRALELNVFEACSGCLDGVVVRLDKDGVFVPFDYGYPALVYDKSKITLKENVTLASLSTHPQMRNKLAWIDPRTSSLGLTFLAWTRQAMSNEEAERFWRGMGTQVLTFSPGWSGAYGLFLKGDARFTLSYTTSPAYHLTEDPKSQVRAILFPEGQIRQTEGVSVVRYSKQKSGSTKWIKHLLSEEIQQQLPLRQWMYPARADVVLPPVFLSLPKIHREVVLDRENWGANREKWIREWTRWVAAVR